MKTRNEDHKEVDQAESIEKASNVGIGITFGLLGGTAFAAIVSSFFEGLLLWSMALFIGMLIGIFTGAILEAKEERSES